MPHPSRSGPSDPQASDPHVDEIAAALARIRGRGRGASWAMRDPRDPYDGRDVGSNQHHGRGSMHGPDRFGDRDSGDVTERGTRGGAPEHDAHDRGHGRRGHGPAGHGHRGGGFPGPPWGAGPGRIGGPARMRMLEALAAASHPLSIGEIADAVGVDQPRASRLVQQSVELELVRREADPDDARRTRVALTDQGRASVTAFAGGRREAVSTALTAFTDAERADLARLLTKLADGWPSP